MCILERWVCAQIIFKADRTQDSGRVYSRTDFGAGCIVTEQASADLRKFHNGIRIENLLD
jgi:hypothetical protein